MPRTVRWFWCCKSRSLYCRKPSSSCNRNARWIVATPASPHQATAWTNPRRSPCVLQVRIQRVDTRNTRVTHCHKCGTARRNRYSRRTRPLPSVSRQAAVCVCGWNPPSLWFADRDIWSHRTPRHAIDLQLCPCAYRGVPWRSQHHSAIWPTRTGRHGAPQSKPCCVSAVHRSARNWISRVLSAIWTIFDDPAPRDGHLAARIT